MSVLVTGSIGIDTVETPQGRADEVLGGSAVYFSLAAALFSDVRLVAVVGEDFDRALLNPLGSKRIDTDGLETRAGSKTFRWHGKYHENMDDRDTVDVQLNVLAEQNAPVPGEYADSRCVFLANTHPALQKELAQQFKDASLIVCDTMNLWIENEADALRETLAVVHGLVLNDAEARQMTGKYNLIHAAREILKLGPRFVVIKKGENGSMLVSHDDVFQVPAYPTSQVVDPTGCGDSFAGAFMGYLDEVGQFDGDALRGAMARGSVTASYVIESFSVESAAAITRQQVDGRLNELASMTRFS